MGSYATVPHADGEDVVLANYTVQATEGVLSVTPAKAVITADDVRGSAAGARI